ncbi:MAG: DUF4340 domain-containing protein [Microcystaceae cyanobacterium]
MVEKNNNLILRFPKNTLILIGVALTLAGSVTVLEIQRQNQPAVTNPSSTQKHFDFSEDAVQAITLYHQGNTLKIYRGSESKPTWKMDLPTTFEVSEPAVTFLINLLTDSQSSRDFNTDIEKLKEYGLVKPQGTITVQLKNGKTHTIFLGEPDFKGDSLYALINAPTPVVNPVKISLISRTFQDMVKRSPTDWKKADEIPSPTTIPNNAPVPKTQD